jgi:diguanylate cyclase (GGDEF)-like protein
MAEDALTGLHDRKAFQLALRRQVGAANEKQESLALMVADVDGFAAINGIHGYEFGDRALRHLSEQLRQVARGHDYVARIGDNRFAMILPRVMNPGHAELAVQKLLRLLDTPYQHGEARVKLAVTVGVAMCPLHATHPEYLTRLAERALHAARLAGRRYEFPPEAGKDDSLSELWDLEMDLSGAVQRGEMKLLYQPKVRCSDGRPLGAEALMRWQHRSRGLVSPDVFIPIAERTGQIKPLTIWAMNTALRQAAEWTHPFGDLSVAVNVPADLVAQHDLPELVENALKLWGKEHVQLALEITERSLVATPEQSFRLLTRIRELGVKVSIDDFGTGYSCLAYFRNIPADELKIDKSFVASLLDDPACAELCSVIIDLAHRFGLSVVGEGVEEEATARALDQRGCDVAQGHLYGKAMPAEAFQAWLDAQAGTGPKAAIG